MAKRVSDVFITVDKGSRETLEGQITRQIKDAVRRGELEPSDVLPSIRRLADIAHVSHVTAENAYRKLAVAGIVQSVPRSGFIVCASDLTRARQAAAPANRMQVERSSAERHHGETGYAHAAPPDVLYDFSYTNLPNGSFPAQDWKRAEDEVLFSEEGRRWTSSFPDMSRPSRLQAQAASFFARTRGVDCMPEQVVVAPGTPASLDYVLQLFDRQRHSVGIAEPGFTNFYEIAVRLGFDVDVVRISQGFEQMMHQLKSSSPKVFFCAPSNQFPSGTSLTDEQRRSLLKWADERNAYIIEDDHAFEYHYDGPAPTSLYAADGHDRVIYMGSVSETLSPTLRVSFIILPPKLLGRYLRTFTSPSPVPWLVQETLAVLTERGVYERHVQEMVHDSKRKRDVLVEELESAFGSGITIESARTGTHLHVEVKNGMSEQELITSARRQQVAVYGTDHFWFMHTPHPPAVLIGYSSIPIEKIRPGVARLRKAWL